MSTDEDELELIDSKNMDRVLEGFVSAIALQAKQPRPRSKENSN